MAMATTEPAVRTWLRRIAWLLLIWGVSVGAMAGVAFLLRLLMAAVGLRA